MKIISTACTLLCILLVSCAPEEMDLETDKTISTEIVLSKEKLNMVEGDIAPLSAIVRPWNGNEKAVSWLSSDETVATVSEKGNVKAIAAGTTTITARCGKLSASCEVSVKKFHIAATSVRFLQKQLSLEIGEKSFAQIEILPQDATDKAVWRCADAEILHIDEVSGEIRGLKDGMATISVSVSGITASIPVQVHGDLWIVETDALEKPVSFEEFEFSTDTIRVARGEAATYQGIVHALGDIGNISAKLTKFAKVGTDGGIDLTPKIYWLKEVRCTERWDAWAGGRPSDAYPANQIYFPDPQIPVDKEQTRIYKNQKKAFWVEFTIPQDFPSGLYEGTVMVESGSGSTTDNFYVQVYDVTLPEKQSMNVVEWIDYDTKYMNGGKEVDIETNFRTFLPEIVRFMNDYGQNCYQMLYAGYGYDRRDSWGWHSQKMPDGTYAMKYSFNDTYWSREFEFFEENSRHLSQIHGTNIVAARDLEGGKLTVSAYELDPKGGIKVDAEERPIHTYVTFPTDDPQQIELSKTFLRDYFYQLQEYLRAHKLKDGRSWLDVYVQTISDEPNDKIAKAYNQVASIIKESAPDLKLLEPIETGLIEGKNLDFPCPTLGKIDEYRAKEGQTQWMYVCVQPQGEFANRFIRIPLFKSRLVHWVQYKYNASGFLHWALNYWRRGINGDPWNGMNSEHVGGDSWLIWPGEGTVYPSIRLSAMRDGIRDYELLRMIDTVSPAKAEEICGKVVFDNEHYNLDLDNFRNVRREMLEFLEK